MTATATALLAEDAECGLSAAEIAEWFGITQAAKAAMAPYEELIKGLMES